LLLLPLPPLLLLLPLPLPMAAAAHHCHEFIKVIPLQDALHATAHVCSVAVLEGATTKSTLRA
jgi:squalene cyclase